MPGSSRAEREQARREADAPRDGSVQILRAAAPPQALVARLGRLYGNRWVANMLARAGDELIGDSADVAAASEAEAVTWPSVLPAAVRSAAEDALSLDQAKSSEKERAPVLGGEVKGGPAGGLDKTRQLPIVKFIRKHREDNAGLGSRLKLSADPKAGWGWGWGDPAGTKDVPTELQGTADPSEGKEAKRKQIEQWIWQELGHEGGTIAINAYDQARMTWGRGLAASGGALQDFIANLPAAVTNDLLKFGIAIEGGQFKVVNGRTGAVETGTAALMLIQGRKDILAGFIAVGEAHRQAITDAQWPIVKKHSAQIDKSQDAKKRFVTDDALFDDVATWPRPIVQLVAHVTHLGPARGTWHDWKGRRGPATGAREVTALQALGEAWARDLVGDIVTKMVKSLAGKEEGKGTWIISANTQHIAELRAWGGGIGAYWLARHASGPLATTKQKILAEEIMGGRCALNAGSGLGFYVWPKLTADEEAKLGPDQLRNDLKALNGLSMEGMLAALEKWPAERITKFLIPAGQQGAVTEAQELVAAVANEERIWWAMQVVQNKRRGLKPPDVPRYGAGEPLPKGKKAGEPRVTGDDYLLVSRDDQRTAWKYLGKEKQMPAELKE